MAIDGSVISTMIAVGGPMASIFGLGWWLSHRFSDIETKLRDRADRLAQTTRYQLDEHEDRDQERHEENLERFRTISVSLAKLGASNGSAGEH